MSVIMPIKPNSSFETKRRCMAKSRYTPKANSVADKATDVKSVNQLETKPERPAAAR